MGGVSRAVSVHVDPFRSKMYTASFAVPELGLNALASAMASTLPRTATAAPKYGPATLGVSVHGVAVFPGAPMRGRFVSTPHNLTSQVRHLLDGLSDHEGRDLNAMLVE